MNIYLPTCNKRCLVTMRICPLGLLSSELKLALVDLRPIQASS